MCVCVCVCVCVLLELILRYAFISHISIYLSIYLNNLPMYIVSPFSFTLDACTRAGR